MDDIYLIDALATVIANRIIDRIYIKNKCCAGTSNEAIIPDCAVLIDEVLSKAKVIRPKPIPIEIKYKIVKIFEGPFAGSFGMLYQRQPSNCSCCFLIQTISGVVKVNKDHCYIQFYP